MGDHILGEYAPNISLWRLDDDIFGRYLQNLDKIADLEIGIVLPGHNDTLTDCRGRIGELKAYYNKRLADIMNIIGAERMNAAQAAGHIKWNLYDKRWSEFSWRQKLFAVGETMAHLYHLVAIGNLAVSSVDNIAMFEKI